MTEEINYSEASGFRAYRTFQENLARRMSAREIHSLRVLGPDFFNLVDRIAQDLQEQRPHDHLMMEMTEDEFLWELQVFANQFIRQCAESPLKLKPFCSHLMENLDDPEFRVQFDELLTTFYEQHFFTDSSESGLVH